LHALLHPPRVIITRWWWPFCSYSAFSFFEAKPRHLSQPRREECTFGSHFNLHSIQATFVRFAFFLIPFSFNESYSGDKSYLFSTFFCEVFPALLDSGRAFVGTLRKDNLLCFLWRVFPELTDSFEPRLPFLDLLAVGTCGEVMRETGADFGERRLSPNLIVFLEAIFRTFGRATFCGGVTIAV